MSIVPVQLGSQSYSVVIESGALEQVGERLAELVGVRTVAVITDDNVRAYYAEPVVRSLRQAGHEASLVTITPGEEQKTLRTAEKLYDRFFELGLDRHSVVVALGGGVVGDLAGFVAGTFMRGIAYVQVPTTLVAQVDSSIGGKTGVDRPQGKNTVGVFHQPKAVYIDPPVLRTLPAEEFTSGMAEVIKCGIIADAALFEELERRVAEVRARQPDVLESMIRRCCEIKADVVGRDEFDQSVRAILNFGHTFGHAIEAATRYRVYRHGEAVAIGMALACELAADLGMFERRLVLRVQNILEMYGLPRTPERVDIDRVLRLLAHDKKARGGRPRFILPTQIGQVVIRGDVSEDVIRSVVELSVREVPGPSSRRGASA